MPVLPTVDAKRNIEANTAAPIMTGATEALKPMEQLGKTVVDLTQKWSDANDVMQYTATKGAFATGEADIMARAAADPDFNNTAKYEKELADLKKNTLGGIGNAMVRNKAALEFDYDAKISGIKINAQFQQKQLAYNKVQFNTSMADLQRKMINSEGNEKQKYADEILELTRMNTATGVISPKEAEDAIKDAQTIAIKYDIYEDTATEEKNSLLLKELQNKNSEKYKFLDPTERLKLIKESQDRIYQNNQTMKNAVKTEAKERTDALTTDLANQSVDLRRIDQEFSIPEESGGIDRDTLRNYKKIVIQGNTDTLQQIVANQQFAGDYYNAFDTILNQEDRSKAMELIVKAWADQKLSLQEGAYLDSVLKETGKANPLGMAVRNVWRGVRGYKGTTEKEAGLSLNELIKRAMNGIDPVIASKQILTEKAISLNPDLGKVTETPTLWMDSDGSIKEITMKDGFLTYSSPKGSPTK